MTPEITRSFDIDMGHRLMNHEGKCRNAHGHRYTIEVSCRGLVGLDHVGRVIDFGVIKEKVGGWLDDVFDHGFVAQEGDPIAGFLQDTGQKGLTIDCPPSVENLVKIWFSGAAELLAEYGILVTKVRAYETAKCFAEYTVSDAKHSKTDVEMEAMVKRLNDEEDARMREAREEFDKKADGG